MDTTGDTSPSVEFIPPGIEPTRQEAAFITEPSAVSIKAAATLREDAQGGAHLCQPVTTRAYGFVKVESVLVSDFSVRRYTLFVDRQSRFSFRCHDRHIIEDQTPYLLGAVAESFHFRNHGRGIGAMVFVRLNPLRVRESVGHKNVYHRALVGRWRGEFDVGSDCNGIFFVISGSLYIEIRP